MCRRVFFLIILLFSGTVTTKRNIRSGYPGYPFQRQSSMCNGEENLKSDIGILSFALGGVSSFAGFYSLQRFSIPSNDVSIWSTLFGFALWVPGGILTAFPFSGPLAYISGNLINLGSLAVTIYGAVSIIHGTTDIIISTNDEILGILSLLLSALTTFPDVYDEVKQFFQQVLGKDEVDVWIRNYGCNMSEQAESTLKYFRNVVLYGKY